MKPIKLLVLTAVATSCVISTNSWAKWQLDNQTSSFNFVTTKKQHIAEAHHFKQLIGEVSDSGAVNLTIDLTSVDTKIPIRDQRMQQFLFNTAKFAKASFTGQVDAKALAMLKVGNSKKFALNGQIHLHGQQQAVNTQVLVTKINNNSFQVSSTQPIIINANQFELVKGIEKLRQLAGLPSISYAVPVSFTLSFNKQ